MTTKNKLNMAKNSGGTRSRNLSLISDYNSILKDARSIFTSEAKKGLGENFMRRQPKEITPEKYNELLNSGDYIEVYHGGSSLSGKYYLSKELQTNGFGYYFTPYEQNAMSYADKYGKVYSALVRKSDIYQFNGNEERNLRNKGLNDVLKGKKISEDYKKDYYNRTTVAARNGHKAVKSYGQDIIIIDRSILITRKNG